jgi:DNA polymerase-1
MLIVDTVEKLLRSKGLLKNSQIIACDLEADGLNIIKSKLQGIGYGTNKNTFFIPFPNKMKQEEIVGFLTELFKDKSVIFHNAKFDMKMLIHHKFPVPKNFHDTMIMSWLIDENSRHGLKELVKELFDRDSKKWNELNSSTDLFRTQEDVMEELAEYCCVDVKNTFDLFNHFYPQLDKEGVKVDYERVELKVIPILVAMELRGIKVDVSWLKDKQEDALKELNRLEKTILTKLREVSKELPTVINIRSPQQIERILFDILKYASVKETESKKRSTDNEVLETIVKKNKLGEDDIVSMLLKFRDLDKVYGMLYEQILCNMELEQEDYLQMIQTSKISQQDMMSGMSGLLLFREMGISSYWQIILKLS